jgi:hypothetical protein
MGLRGRGVDCRWKGQTREYGDSLSGYISKSADRDAR